MGAFQSKGKNITEQREECQTVHTCLKILNNCVVAGVLYVCGRGLGNEVGRVR